MGEITIKIPQSVKREYHIASKEFLTKLERLVEETNRTENETDLGLADEIENDARASRMKWLKENREEYSGQYVALDGNRLVGTGRTIREAREQAKQKGVKNPFLVRVSGESEILSGGL
jgi:hypothetical protein